MSDYIPIKVKLILAILLVLFNVYYKPAISLNTDTAPENILPVYVNEEPSGYNSVAIDGQWYIKLRDICNIYCVQINYNDITKTITVYDKSSPTIINPFTDKIIDQTSIIIDNGHVYVPLKNILTFNTGHMEQGHLDITRTFSFHNGSWFYSSFGEQEQPLKSVDSYQQKGELAYVMFFTPNGDTITGRSEIWEFDSCGYCRVVADYWPRITSFAVDDDDVFIVGVDTWNASSVWKFSLTDGAENCLGQTDYDYGDNLSRTLNNSLANNNITPLPHSGIIVRDDGVYTVGYSRYGYFENSIIDKNIFTDTYGYYRLSKDGRTHEKVDEWPQ